jgi:hypothetical protein
MFKNKNKDLLTYSRIRFGFRSKNQVQLFLRWREYYCKGCNLVKYATILYKIPYYRFILHFRPLSFMFRKDWYSLQRFEDPSLLINLGCITFGFYKE